MPTWLVIIFTSTGMAAGFSVAVGTLYKAFKSMQDAARPAAQLLSDAAEHNDLLRQQAALFGDGQLMPLLIDMKTSLAKTAAVFPILNEIVSQVRNDSGSTIKDRSDKQEIAATLNAQAVQDLRVQVEVLKELVGHLHNQGALGLASGLRTEVAAGIVKDNLHASEVRADAVTEGDTGAAADAAARSEPPPE